MATSNNYFSLYIQQVLQLAATLVIKSEATAQAQNRWVTDYFGADMVDAFDPSSWRYYLNLAGKYHPVDTPMTVVSLDTQDEIVFSVENLLIHRATARAYRYGSRQYKELVARYPDQARLILGILHPLDIDAAIAAPDFQILGVLPGLVEENEYSLLTKLQTWINRFRVRWINEQFGLSDSLYPATALGMMYALMVPAIIAIRLEACKTNEAHSFHVRQYLASHGFLDQFFDKLTLKQRLFFYRNITYIERNAGKRDTFDWLVEHIMTERRFPIAEYVMRHNLAHQPEELYPTLTFDKHQLNLGTAAQVSHSLNLEQILIKEDQMALDNERYRPDYLPKIKKQMENSQSNVVLTKLLESAMVDYSNSAPHTLAEILVNEWLSQAADGSYTAYVTPTNPRTGELMPLTVKEAYIFTWWIFCRSIGVRLTTVPAMVAFHAQRTPMASVDDIYSVVDHTLVSRDLAVQALSVQPVIPKIISVDTFYDVCVKIRDACTLQRNITALQEHHTRRAMVANMCERIYADRVIHLEPEGTLYSEWFGSRNMQPGDFSVSDLALLYNDIVREATGQVSHPTVSLKEIQRAMIKMLSRLSSYSIQITSEINDSDVKRTDWTAVRVGNVTGHYQEHDYFPDAAVSALDIHIKPAYRTDMPLGMPHQHKLLKLEETFHWQYGIPTKVKTVTKHIERPGRLRAASAVRLHNQPAPNSEGIMAVPGYETFLAMTPEERSRVKDIYTTPYMPVMPPDAREVSQAVLNPVLNGLDYIPTNSLRDDDGNPIRDNDGNPITT